LDSDNRDDWLTLRESILLSNGTLNFGNLTVAEQSQVSDGLPGPGVPDTIKFNILGLTAHRILVGSGANNAPLPAITDAWTTIDGYSQPGAVLNADPIETKAILKIELDGSWLLA
jgi:hypothetical protein